MARREGKFYANNEKRIMKLLGLEPTKASGSGWIEKEDGQNEHIICQLKSTDKNSMQINRKDLQTLEYNAIISNKLPVFAIQFISGDDIYLLIRPEDLQDVSIRLELAEGEVTQGSDLTALAEHLDSLESEGDSKRTKRKTKLIKSSAESRQRIMKENDDKFKKKERKAT